MSLSFYGSQIVKSGLLGLYAQGFPQSLTFDLYIGSVVYMSQHSKCPLGTFVRW